MYIRAYQQDKLTKSTLGCVLRCDTSATCIIPRYSVSAFAKRVILLMRIKYSSEFVPPRVDSVEESPIYSGVGSELEQILTRSEAVPTWPTCTCRCSRQRGSEFVPPHVEDTQIHSGAGRNWSRF